MLEDQNREFRKWNVNVSERFFSSIDMQSKSVNATDVDVPACFVGVSLNVGNLCRLKQWRDNIVPFL